MILYIYSYKYYIYILKFLYKYIRDMDPEICLRLWTCQVPRCDECLDPNKRTGKDLRATDKPHVLAWLRRCWAWRLLHVFKLLIMMQVLLC